MIKIALTGNRFSGKDSVAKEFEKIGVQVFHADPIIKFMLNYRSDIENQIKNEKILGDRVFSSGFLDSNKIKSTDQFDKLIQVIEFDLFSAYNKWLEKYPSHIYTIFHSSILFEREWEQYFDKIINVFCPRDERTSRIRLEMNMPMYAASDLIDSEINEFKKNGKSTYVIHSYRDRDIVKQVCDCDKSIIDNYLSVKEKEKNSKFKPHGHSKFNGFVM